MNLLVNIDVADLERAIAFYRDALGLRLRRRLFAGTVAEMDGGSSLIYLLEKSADSAASSTSTQKRDYARHWTPVHLDFEVADVQTAVRTALAAGATLEGEIQNQRWGRIANLADPFGNGFCLLEFVGRGYDEAAD